MADRANRLLILPVESEGSGLAETAEVGYGWLERRVLQAGVVEVVDYPTVARSVDSAQVGDLKEMAEAAFADLLVRGTARRLGDSIAVTARIVQGRSLVTLTDLGRETAPLTDPVGAFDRMADRLLGALAARKSNSYRWPEHRPPPSVTVLSLERAALDAFYVTDYDEFHRLADRVRDLAPDYLSFPLVSHRASAFWNERHRGFEYFKRSDSTIAFLESRVDALSPRDRRELRWMRAAVSGDLANEFEAAAAPSIAQASEDHPYRLAMSSRRTNRLELALALIERRYLMHPRAANYRAWDQVQLRVLARMRAFEHLVTAARAAQGRHPQYGLYLQMEARAFAAQGMEDSVQAVMARSRTLPQDENFHPVSHLVEAARVAGAEGYPKVSQRFAQMALDSAAAWTSPDVDPLMALSMARGLLGDWTGAAAGFRQVARQEERPLALMQALGAQGGALALSGDEGGAQAVLSRLEQIENTYEDYFLAGEARWHQARVLAALGRGPQAIELIQRALETGQTHGVWELWDPFFLPLHADARYRRVVAPWPFPD